MTSEWSFNFGSTKHEPLFFAVGGKMEGFPASKSWLLHLSHVPL
jgi:hypothetical protein